MVIINKFLRITVINDMRVSYYWNVPAVSFRIAWEFINFNQDNLERAIKALELDTNNSFSSCKVNWLETL